MLEQISPGDDSAVRALKRMDEAEAVYWLQSHLQSCYEL